MGIAKALGLHRGEVERFKTLEVDIAFKMGTRYYLVGKMMYLGFLGQECVYLAFLGWSQNECSPGSTTSFWYHQCPS